MVLIAMQPFFMKLLPLTLLAMLLNSRKIMAKLPPTKAMIPVMVTLKALLPITALLFKTTNMRLIV